MQLAVSTKTCPEQYVGTVGIRTENLSPSVGDVGIELIPELWGHGAAREIVLAFVAWAREHMGIITLSAETAYGNRAAERLALTAGLRLVMENKKRHWQTPV
ncbi:GNAT family N-acetyltransferase [Phyllobacterium sp. K27]